MRAFCDNGRLNIEFHTYDEFVRLFGNDGGYACPHCLSRHVKIYKVPLRYGQYDDVLQHACAYCISQLAQRKKNKEKLVFVDCIDCGREFCRKPIAGWSYMQAVGMFGIDGLKSLKKHCGSFFESVEHYQALDICDRCCEVRSLKRKKYNSEKKRVSSQNRRTKELGLVSDLTIEQWIGILESHNYLCHYCGEIFSDMEHVIPVSYGGGTTASNVVPCCRSCNMRMYRNFVGSPYLLTDAGSMITYEW